MLPEEAIDEFKNIYESELCEPISVKEATEEANIFISLFKALIDKSEAKNNIDKNTEEGGI